MCERKSGTQYRVMVYYNGGFIGDSYHWNKPSANRTYDKQTKKAGVTAMMYSPEGRRIRG